MANTSDKVLKVAKAELGYLEKSAKAYKKNPDVIYKKTEGAGYDNYTKYGAWIGMTPAFWCAQFICWIFSEAYGKQVGKEILYGKYSSACETIRQNFISNKAYDRQPKVASLIFFEGTRHSGANHIGIVTKVDSKYVYTIEGNTSSGSGVIDNGGAVSEHAYNKTSSYILGYGHPKYDTEPTPAPTPTPKKKTVVTYCSHLENGEWLGQIKGYNNTDTNGYSGVIKKPIDAFMVKGDGSAKITYRAHSCESKKWYPAVTGYSKTDSKNGYAGEFGKQIDAIMIKGENINGKLKYRVHIKDGKWLPWVTGYNAKDNENGYAGNLGQPIDAIQIGIE